MALMLAPGFAMADAAVEPVSAVGAASPGNCGLITVAPGNFNAGGYLAVDLSTPGGQAALQTATVALALGRHIFVNRIGQAAGCYGLTDYATDVRLLNY
jgi:hypothetical protein